MHSKGNYKQGEKTTSEWEKIIVMKQLTKDQSPKYTSSSSSSLPEKQTTQRKSGENI